MMKQSMVWCQYDEFFEQCIWAAVSRHDAVINVENEIYIYRQYRQQQRDREALAISLKRPLHLIGRSRGTPDKIGAKRRIGSGVGHRKKRNLRYRLFHVSDMVQIFSFIVWMRRYDFPPISA
jgi:hypothetical protein